MLLNVSRNLKIKQQLVHDGLKPELYKVMVKNEKCLQVLTACFQEELNKESMPTEWKASQTKMIPKTTKPTAKDLRPIALTNIL